jgi:hypothetical protein
MHLYALNLPDLMISFWQGTMQCDSDDDKSTWDWAVLKGKVWEEHGAADAHPHSIHIAKSAVRSHHTGCCNVQDKIYLRSAPAEEAD